MLSNAFRLGDKQLSFERANYAIRQNYKNYQKIIYKYNKIMYNNGVNQMNRDCLVLDVNNE